MKHLLHLTLLTKAPDSSKFWEIDVIGDTCEIQSGTTLPLKIKKQVRKFKDENEALKEAELLIQQKRKQGFVDQPPGSREIESGKW